MASRILTFVSCTVYVFLLLTFTIIGFASFIIGSIGTGLYIPTERTFNTFHNNTCQIVDIDYGPCQDSCYFIMWSVEFYVSSQYVFSTIREKFETDSEMMDKVENYNLLMNRTCFYDETLHVRVQWNQPASSRPYFIMIIVGFSLTGIYLILIGFFYYKRSYEF